MADDSIMVKGIRGRAIKLCRIQLKSKWKNGEVTVGVIDLLPMEGVSILLINDIGAVK